MSEKPDLLRSREMWDKILEGPPKARVANNTPVVIGFDCEPSRQKLGDGSMSELPTNSEKESH